MHINRPTHNSHKNEIWRWNMGRSNPMENCPIFNWWNGLLSSLVNDVMRCQKWLWIYTILIVLNELEQCIRVYNKTIGEHNKQNEKENSIFLFNEFDRKKRLQTDERGSMTRTMMYGVTMGTPYNSLENWDIFEKIRRNMPIICNWIPFVSNSLYTVRKEMMSGVYQV